MPQTWKRKLVETLHEPGISTSYDKELGVSAHQWEVVVCKNDSVVTPAEMTFHNWQTDGRTNGWMDKHTDTLRTLWGRASENYITTSWFYVSKKIYFPPQNIEDDPDGMNPKWLDLTPLFQSWSWQPSNHDAIHHPPPPPPAQESNFSQYFQSLQLK